MELIRFAINILFLLFALMWGGGVVDLWLFPKQVQLLKLKDWNDKILSLEVESKPLGKIDNKDLKKANIGLANIGKAWYIERSL